MKRRFKFNQSPKLKLRFNQKHLGKIPLLNNLKQNSSIKTRLIASFILLSVIPSIIIAGIVYFISRNTLEEKVSGMSLELNTQISMNLNNAFSDIERLMLQPYGNLELMNRLLDEDLTDYEIVQARQQANNYFSSLMLTNSDINTIFFIRDDGILFGDQGVSTRFNSSEYLNSLVSQKVHELNGELYWEAGFQGNDQFIYVFKHATGDSLNGTFVIILKKDQFTQIVNSSSSSSVDQNMYIVDHHGEVVESNLVDRIGQIYVENADKHMLQTINQLSNDWNVIIETDRDSLLQEINGVITLIAIIVLIIIIIAAGIGVFVTLGITKPINRIRDLMQSAEGGNLTVRASEQGGHELSQLGKSFNTMIENIKRVIEQNRYVASYAVNSSEELKRISNDSYHKAKEIALSTEEMAKGAEEQVYSSENTNQAMEYLSNEIETVTNNISVVNQSTENTKKLSEEAFSIIHELVSNNAKVEKEIAVMRDQMMKLNQEMTQVSEFVTIIKDISEQTNLLALNASIEAARAGEHGRGFAVVAEEVRSLADQSKKASIEIEDVIKDVIKQSIHTVESVRAFDQQIKMQSSSVDNTKTSFENIIEDNALITKQINLIEKAIQNINETNKAVSYAVSEMVSVAQNASATTEEITATTEEQLSSAQLLDGISEELVKTINELEQVISTFTVE
ncbi:methyl-accepting chemotaxis protein [Globicatella sulfidifaciens]|uniref:Methyl-accepting chemotaxis protein n=1 Tax=Globicatella sulfidifaciens TaxID=136093 RepID=A0A7X8C513_9LACT|nr:methyl-accepting chemotaxis protein [Globicatella sulfidifaciens]NLJ18919.1 methyl-accepting chemotaxis protein [Globicatella sulfidifaciens]